MPTGNTVPISLSISGPAAIDSPTGTFTQSTDVIVKGLSAGTATITATVSNSDGATTVGSTSFTVVQPPVVQSISPAQGLIGTPISVTITGSGFSAGTTSVNAGSNLSVSNVSVSSSTQMTATFTPANSSSAGGNQGVTVSVGGGPNSNSMNFFNQVPTHLGYIDESSTPNDGHSSITSGTDINIINVSGTTLASGVCGGYQWITYGLADQSGNQIKNGTVTFNELFSNISPSPDPFGSPVVGPPSSPNLATQVLGDTYAIYDSSPPACPPANKNDSFNQQWTATVGGVVYPLKTVISIARSTNSQGLPTFTSSITTP